MFRTLSEVMMECRTRAALEPADVAEQAGITERQYSALETGTAWPGSTVVRAVLNVLQNPAYRHIPLQRADSHLDECSQRILHAYDVPALLVDNEWRTVEANCLAQGLLPFASQLGSSLTRWILLGDEARARLANWEDIARNLTPTLQDITAARSHEEELHSIRDRQEQLDALPTEARCLDGQLFVWRSDNGPHPITTCLVTFPGTRPDLQQITFVPRPTQPTQTLLHPHPIPQTWDSQVLAGLLTCGICGLSLTSGGTPTTFFCATGCLPVLPSEELQHHVAQETLPRAFSPDTCRRLGAAQEILTYDQADMALNVPVNTRHALYQWRHAMTPAQRRGILTSTLRSITVYPVPNTTTPPTVALSYSWHEMDLP
ncbi:helix-turn-helix transcriptional regulator [Streptomyces sp. NPDC047082]|uniref:helix-turn-helix transcriptional regulator n=1 Tax=Streptomyces sp. NPDC047082 TaxID=3155259 RepID=UPI003411504B